MLGPSPLEVFLLVGSILFCIGVSVANTRSRRHQTLTPRVVLWPLVLAACATALATIHVLPRSGYESDTLRWGSSVLRAGLFWSTTFWGPYVLGLFVVRVKLDGWPEIPFVRPPDNTFDSTTMSVQQVFPTASRVARNFQIASTVIRWGFLSLIMLSALWCGISIFLSGFLQY